MDLVEDFKKEIRKEEIRRVQLRKEKGKERVMNLKVEMFKRCKLLRKYILKILFRQNNGKFEDEYLKKLKRSWARWKGKERQVPPEVEP